MLVGPLQPQPRPYPEGLITTTAVREWSRLCLKNLIWKCMGKLLEIPIQTENTETQWPPQRQSQPWRRLMARPPTLAIRTRY